MQDFQSAAAKGAEVRNGDLRRRSDDSFVLGPESTAHLQRHRKRSRKSTLCYHRGAVIHIPCLLWGCRLAFCASHSIRSITSGKCRVYFFFLLFVPFSLLASKKSSDTRKYRLLIKRNPVYFLGAFFHLLGTLGLLSTTVLYFGKN
jgi:hypothetical protein